MVVRVGLYSIPDKNRNTAECGKALPVLLLYLHSVVHLLEAVLLLLGGACFVTDCVDFRGKGIRHNAKNPFRMEMRRRSIEKPWAPNVQTRVETILLNLKRGKK